MEIIGILNLFTWVTGAIVSVVSWKRGNEMNLALSLFVGIIGATFGITPAFAILNITDNAAWIISVGIIGQILCAFALLWIVSMIRRENRERAKKRKSLEGNHYNLGDKIPDICPLCKNPNTKKLLECEWCGNKIC